MKPSYRPTYSLLDVLSASPSQPMPVTSREYQLALMHAALDAITRGEQPTKDDWRVLCDAVNMVDTLVAKGVAEDKDGLLQDATMALATAAKRSLSGALSGSTPRALLPCVGFWRTTSLFSKFYRIGRCSAAIGRPRSGSGRFNKGAARRMTWR